MHVRKYNEDDARDTFKTLKNQLPGECNAHLFHTWATLEAGSGNLSKALSIQQKGMKERAQPSRYGQSLSYKKPSFIAVSATRSPLSLQSQRQEALLSLQSQR
jgi:hypothetical protein